MARFKTFVNGGSILPGDLNSMQDDYEANFAGWRQFLPRGGKMAASSVAGTYVATTVDANMSVIGATHEARYAFHIDPADVPAAPRSVLWRTRFVVVSNTVAPTAVTFGAKLMRAATFGGASGAEPSIATWVEQVNAGAAITNPPASASTAAVSATPMALVAGLFFFAFTIGTTLPAGHVPVLRAVLQYRQV